MTKPDAETMAEDAIAVAEARRLAAENYADAVRQEYRELLAMKEAA